MVRNVVYVPFYFYHTIIIKHITGNAFFALLTAVHEVVQYKEDFFAALIA